MVGGWDKSARPREYAPMSWALSWDKRMGGCGRASHIGAIAHARTREHGGLSNWVGCSLHTSGQRLRAWGVVRVEWRWARGFVCLYSVSMTFQRQFTDKAFSKRFRERFIYLRFFCVYFAFSLSFGIICR